MTIKARSEKQLSDAITDKPRGTGILAFRDLEKILNDHVKGKVALDFGCGVGRISVFLKKLRFDVIGVDISVDMINKAKQLNHDIDFYAVRSDGTDLRFDNQFDLILIAFVLMEISSKELIVETFKKLKKLLNTNGKIVVIAASDNFYQGNWLSLKTDYEGNRKAKSGDIVKIYLKEYGVEVDDYLWKESDCERFFKESGLKIIEMVKPLGTVEDGKQWIDELTVPPFVIYVLSNIFGY